MPDQKPDFATKFRQFNSDWGFSLQTSLLLYLQKAREGRKMKYEEAIKSEKGQGNRKSSL